jgi:PAS domain S-box-containing protein
MSTPAEPVAAPAAPAKVPLRALIVEDSEFDARMLLSVLRKGGYDPAHRRVQTAEEMRQALAAQPWDVILADYNMPEFSAPEALKVLQASGLDIPFLIVSGGIGEDIAVAAMKAGAHDYLMKGNLARLAPAVERELREAAVRAARRHAEASLRESELRYRQLWETATDAVLLMDEDLVVSFANPAVQEVFGRAPAEVVGRSLQSLGIRLVWGIEQADLDPAAVKDIIQHKRRAVEGITRRPDGAEVALGVAFSAMELQGRRWVVGFFRDITERKRAEEELRQNQEQFRVAREIQQRLFPKSAPKLPGFDIAGITQPAEATGGDYYDYLPMQHGHLGIVVGDVTGHGLGPALLMAETRAYLRLLALNRGDCGEILTRANLVLAEDVDYEHYVTLVLADLDPVARTLAYCSAGHPSGFVMGADGAVRAELKRSGIPLGLNAETRYQTQPRIELKPGDIVLLPSDGIEEAMSPAGEFFGHERVLETLRANLDRSAAEILEALRLAIRKFAGEGEQLDDVTAVAVKVLAAGQPAG